MDCYGGTPLILAAWRGRAADVAELLAGGADVNEPKAQRLGSYRETALYIASNAGHTEVVTTSSLSSPAAATGRHSSTSRSSRPSARARCCAPAPT